MKKMILRQFLWALFFTGALVFTSCQEDADEIKCPTIDSFNVISPEGGVLSTLGGNVVLVIPAGAVDFTEYLTINVCQGTGVCPYQLQPVSIEPFVRFNKPVELSLKYCGTLCGGNAFDCQQTCVNVLNWLSSRDFVQETQGITCTAVINQNNQSVDLTIYQTGVFAIGRN